jgi:hypothetical protein
MQPRDIRWVYEPEHRLRNADWFWVLGIIATAGAVVAILLSNFLFALVIVLSAFLVGVMAMRPPITVHYAVSARGVHLNERFYPFQSLDSYFFDDAESVPKLRLKSKHSFAPLLSIPVPNEYMHDVERFVAARLPEEEIEEPFAYRVLEFFGF